MAIASKQPLRTGPHTAELRRALDACMPTAPVRFPAVSAPRRRLIPCPPACPPHLSAAPRSFAPSSWQTPQPKSASSTPGSHDPCDSEPAHRRGLAGFAGVQGTRPNRRAPAPGQDRDLRPRDRHGREVLCGGSRGSAVPRSCCRVCASENGMRCAEAPRPGAEKVTRESSRIQVRRVFHVSSGYGVPWDGKRLARLGAGEWVSAVQQG
jgi:hypothetical protein